MQAGQKIIDMAAFPPAGSKGSMREYYHISADAQCVRVKVVKKRARDTYIFPNLHHPAACAGNGGKVCTPRRIRATVRARGHSHSLIAPVPRRMRAALRLCARPRRGVACQAAGCDMAARVCCGCNFGNTLPARVRAGHRGGCGRV